MNNPNFEDRKSVYQNKLSQLSKIIAWRDRTSGLISLGRGALFLVAGLCVIASLTGNLTGFWAYAVPALPLVILIVLAAFQETIQDRQAMDRIRAEINRNQIRRMERKWSDLREPPVEIPANRFHLCKDLDLFGKASLFKILNIANTPLGIRTLVDWILNPADPALIKHRQAAVGELVDQVELREELQLLSRSVADARTDPDHLLDWANGELWLKKRTGLKWFSRISTTLMLISFTSFFFPGSPKMILGGAIIVLFAVHFFMTVLFCGSIHKIFNSVGYRQRDVSTYLDLFLLSKKLSHDSELLKEIRDQLSTGRQNAVQGVGKLETIIGVAQMRRNGFMFLVYLIAQFLFLIDFHTIAWLENWHQRDSHRVKDWLNALAEWEALASLSNLAFHQPDWVFPRVDSRFDRITTTGLGHPLIGDPERVCNDVIVGPQQTLLLVTGSNMSGKSTLLRSIGLNGILAEAGSVVCARKMEMPLVQIETSMRIGDSVSDGISFFMAELKRLRQITVEAEKMKRNPDCVLLFLLDEILQGTNSRERQIAVIRVCEHLLEAGSIGAISTHDLELAEAPGIANCFQTVHFREFFQKNPEGKNEMGFDYVMRAGVSPTTNALKLLEMVGLSKPDSKN